MSTRAIYTFSETGTDDTFHVYKHHDGYPSGAFATIRNAFLYFAWTLPRFEPDEAAASFVAAGKASHLIEFHKGKPDTYADGSPYPMEDWLRYGPTAHLPGGRYRDISGGDVRLLPSGLWLEVAPSDIEYRYEITKPVGNKPVTMTGYAISNDWDSNDWSQKRMGIVKLVDLLAMNDDRLNSLAELWSKRAGGRLKLVEVSK